MRKIFLMVGLLAGFSLITACGDSASFGENTLPGFRAAGDTDAPAGESETPSSSKKPPLGGQSDDATDGGGGTDEPTQPGDEPFDPEMTPCKECIEKCETISRTTTCGESKYNRCIQYCEEKYENMCTDPNL